MPTTSLPRESPALRWQRALGHTRSGATARWELGAGRIDGTGILFVGYLLLIALEWTGIPNEIPLLKVTRFTTLLAYSLLALALARIGKPSVLGERQMMIAVGFIVFTAASVLWTYVQMYAFNSIRPMVDYTVFALTTVYVFDRRSRSDKLAVLFGCISILLVARNLGNLNSQRIGSFAAPYFLGDGNDFAWGLNVMGPIILSLAFGPRTLITRLFALAAFVVCVIGMVGTQSRGGTLGFGAAMLFGWLFVAKRKAVGAATVVLVAVLVVVAAPGGYLSRMNTIVDYEDDNSAQARLQAWGAAIHMALDHPLGVGAGNFGSAYGRFYNPSTTGEGEARVGWGAGRWVNAHSIYFKVLGEYGFPGLALLIWLILANFRDNLAARRLLKRSPAGAPFVEQWPDLLNMSLVAYAVSGMFLGGVAYPFIFLLTGLTLGTKRILDLERRVDGQGETDLSSVGRSAPLRTKAVTLTSSSPRPRRHRGAQSSSL